MRVITLHQPYATLIALGLKSYETRSWFTRYKGPLAIHAGKRPTNLSELSQIVAKTGEEPNPAGIFLENALDPFVKKGFPLGQIVAVVDLASCTPTEDFHPLLPSVDGLEARDRILIERAVGDWAPDRWAWQLSDVRRLKQPVDCVGARGLQPLSLWKAKVVQSLL